VDEEHLSKEERDIIAFDAERLRTDPAFMRGMKNLDQRMTKQLINLDPFSQQAEMVQAQAVIRALRGLAWEIAVATQANVEADASNPEQIIREGTATRQ